MTSGVGMSDADGVYPSGWRRVGRKEELGGQAFAPHVVAVAAQHDAQQGLGNSGADDGNRTRVFSLGS